MKKLLLITPILLLFPLFVAAQPRPVDKTANANAPDVYEARYEGGMFGTSGKDKGTLKIDDANKRVVFYRKSDQKEMFFIPYDALVVIYPDSKESVPQSGKVISALPLPGAGLANLMSKSTKFANLTFDDPDIDVKGTASFRFDTKEELLNFIGRLGTKAEMTQRGDAFYRPKRRSVF